MGSQNSMTNTIGFKKKYALLRSYSLFVIVPLILALIIYVLFRPYPPDNLELIIRWINTYRYQLSSDYDWFVYNLPDGLWAFSFTSFLIIHTRSDAFKLQCLYLATGLSTMILLEVMQIRYLAGRFDILDIAAILLGFVFSLILIKTIKGKTCSSTP